MAMIKRWYMEIGARKKGRTRWTQFRSEVLPLYGSAPIQGVMF
jgi:hypothetical protein